MERIYKIVDRQQWKRAEQAGEFAGAAIDLQDGFIHFSSASQVVETAAKHFGGMEDLVLVAVDASRLGEALRWEPSRGGQLFPHLYGVLPVELVASVQPLEMDERGHHRFPDELPSPDSPASGKS